MALRVPKAVQAQQETQVGLVKLGKRLSAIARKVGIAVQTAILVEIPWVDKPEALRETGNFIDMVITM
ncbi:UNVERIFIED_CONTAM: hypothetical protein K2H54_038468 [Gekko kuhli]